MKIIFLHLWRGIIIRDVTDTVLNILTMLKNTAANITSIIRQCQILVRCKCHSCYKHQQLVCKYRNVLFKIRAINTNDEHRASLSCCDIKSKANQSCKISLTQIYLCIYFIYIQHYISYFTGRQFTIIHIKFPINLAHTPLTSIITH